MLVELTRIVTADGVPLDGAIIDAKGRKRIGVLFVHGLASNFSKSRALWEALAKAGRLQGIGIAAFNNRGHDIIVRYAKRSSGDRRRRSLLLGAGLEDFRKSIHDIRAGVRFLKKRGYRRVVLVGHSTGAQKIAYYAARVRDRSIAGIVLLAPISDVAIRKRELGKEFDRNIAAAQRFTKKHGRFALLPQRIAPGYFSAQRYLSLFRPNSAEDVFPYYNPTARWTAFRSIRIPALVIIGQRDEHLDRPLKNFLAAFTAHANIRARLKTVNIPGAYHGFRHHKNALAKEVLRWIERTF